MGVNGSMGLLCGRLVVVLCEDGPIILAPSFSEGQVVKGGGGGGGGRALWGLLSNKSTCCEG